MSFLESSEEEEPPRGPAPAPAPAGGCDIACGSVEQTSTDGAGTTYRLSIDLSGSAKNVYTIYGDLDNSLVMPPSYQEAAPFGANVGGCNPAFFPIMAGAQFDGWLTVGITGGDTAGALSSIGLDFAGWTATDGLSSYDAAIFWMNPDDGPSETAVVAQVTVSSGFTAVVSAQGRSVSGEDWRYGPIVFEV